MRVHGPRFYLRKELKELAAIVRSLDRKVLIILISAAVLQTISWYFTSRTYFHINFFNKLSSSQYVYLLEFYYWYAGDFFVYFIIPFLIIKIIFKEKPANYGVTAGDANAGIKISLAFILVMLPFIWFFTAQQSFSLTYPLLYQARDSWKIFFIYELGMVFYLFAWEFIWRGFMLFGLKEKFGYYAVVIQMIPFVILHDGKPPVETFGAIAGGIALGILAYRTRSIYYCVITHSVIMFSIDFISTLRYRANDFGVGLNSFLNVIRQIF